MPVEQQWPSVLAMVIADVVHRDTASGKYHILGTHATIAATAFPSTHPSLNVYLCLTDGHGETVLQLRLIDVDESEPALAESEEIVTFLDPREVIETMLALEDVVFPESGEYRLQLYGAGELLQERRIWLLPNENVEWE